MLLIDIKYAPEELEICSAPALFFLQLPGSLNCSLHANTVFPAYTQSFSKSCRVSPLYLTPSLPLTPNTLTVAQGSSLTFSTSLQSHSKHMVWESHTSTDEARERRIHNSIVTQPEQQKPLTHDDWLTLNQWSYLHLNSLASGPASTWVTLGQLFCQPLSFLRECTARMAL